MLLILVKVQSVKSPPKRDAGGESTAVKNRTAPKSGAGSRSVSSLLLLRNTILVALPPERVLVSFSHDLGRTEQLESAL